MILVSFYVLYCIGMMREREDPISREWSPITSAVSRNVAKYIIDRSLFRIGESRPGASAAGYSTRQLFSFFNRIFFFHETRINMNLWILIYTTPREVCPGKPVCNSLHVAGSVFAALRLFYQALLQHQFYFYFFIAAICWSCDNRWKNYEDSIILNQCEKCLSLIFIGFPQV